MKAFLITASIVLVIGIIASNSQKKSASAPAQPAPVPTPAVSGLVDFDSDPEVQSRWQKEQEIAIARAQEWARDYCAKLIAKLQAGADPKKEGRKIPGDIERAAAIAYPDDQSLRAAFDIEAWEFIESTAQKMQREQKEAAKVLIDWANASQSGAQ
jgi:hypothetical protein